jgi:hypothetical protein
MAIYTPLAPSTPVIDSAWNGGVHAYFVDPADGQGTAVTDYRWQWSTDASSWNTFTDATSTSQEVTITGLSNGTAYYVRVAGINAGGVGTYSSASSTATPVATGKYVAIGANKLKISGEIGLKL